MVKPDQIRRSSCPVSCALDILGDRWTLLVIRDIIFKQKRHFGDFLTSPEKIASNILSDRLKKLEDCDIVLRRPDPANARRIIYTLTEKGFDLVPAILELLRWGVKHDPASDAHENLIQRLEQDRAGLMAEIRSSLSTV
jgi:DNA-binding HxlR family transcriptional regulator